MVSTPRPLPDEELERAAEKTPPTTHRARGTHDRRHSGHSGSREERYQPGHQNASTATVQPPDAAAAP